MMSDSIYNPDMEMSKNDSLLGIQISGMLCHSQLLSACRTYAVKLAMQQYENDEESQFIFAFRFYK
jgi:hypothetical protein